MSICGCDVVLFLRFFYIIKYMKTSELLLWGFLGTILIIGTIISSYFKYTYRIKQLKYVQEHTDDKTFANYLFYRQLFGIMVVILVIAYLSYGKNKR
jgi:hypothetical protein